MRVQLTDARRLNNASGKTSPLLTQRVECRSTAVFHNTNDGGDERQYVGAILLDL
jgi:hypothetical protein